MKDIIEKANEMAKTTMEYIPGTEYKECFPYTETKIIEDNGYKYKVDVIVTIVE